jgi:hypothetical protein
MHIPESVFRSDAFPAPTTPVFVAEIACIMCTAVVGTAIDTRWPPVLTVLLELEGSRVLRRVELDRLRCPHCGGNTEATEVTPRLLRRDRVDWRLDRPRVGRPPKWLAAQRAAARPSNRTA